MTIKNAKIGGSDFSTPSDRVKPTDLNDTNDRLAGALIEGTVTFLQGINQATLLSADATITDRTYTWAESETFSDADGYNDFVDTGSTTALWLGDRYVCAPLLYDDFDDNVYDTDLWTKTETVPVAGTATVIEQNQRLEIVCIAPNGAGDQTRDNTAISTTDNNYTDSLQWDCTTLTLAEGGSGGHNGIIEVTIGGVTIVDKDIEDETPVYDDYATGVWTLIKTGASEHKLYLDGVLIRTISAALSGAVAFRSFAHRFGSGTSITLTHHINDVYLNFDTTGFVQTNSKTFDSNVVSALVNGHKDVSMTGSSITVDISTDGGSTFDVTAQALDSLLNLDGDDTDVVLRLNLNRGTTGTPWLFGYSYQGWPQ